MWGRESCIARVTLTPALLASCPQLGWTSVLGSGAMAVAMVITAGKLVLQPPPDSEGGSSLLLPATATGGATAAGGAIAVGGGGGGGAGVATAMGWAALAAGGAGGGGGNGARGTQWVATGGWSSAMVRGGVRACVRVRVRVCACVSLCLCLCGFPHGELTAHRPCCGMALFASTTQAPGAAAVSARASSLPPARLPLRSLPPCPVMLLQVGVMNIVFAFGGQENWMRFISGMKHRCVCACVVCCWGGGRICGMVR